MNPFIELKERLVYLAMAGTQLLSEDFRLKKAAQSFAPLAEKNPVFQKIHTDLEKLLTAPKEQQGTLLLGLLGLIDAVLYTQAAYLVEGEFFMLPAKETVEKAVQSRYSEILPVLQALSTTGSGRVEVLQGTLRKHPSCLQDYRIVDALIHDLNDSYSEMGKLVYQILLSMGSGAPLCVPDPENYYTEKLCTLPQIDKAQFVAQLKQGFDPQGKLEMAKRLYIISCTAQGEENDWYLSLLDTAKKEIRQEAIRALRWREDNIPLLMELLKKERAKGKEIIYGVLGSFNAPELLDFARAELSKNIKSVKYLRNSSSDAISDLIAEFLQADIERWMRCSEIAGEEYEKLCCYQLSLENKTSDKMLDIYRYLIENAAHLPKVRRNKDCSQSFAETFLYIVNNELRNILLTSCPQKLVDFFHSFVKKPKGSIGSAFVFADLLTLPKEEVYEAWHKEDFNTVLIAFQYVTYNDERYQMWNWSNNEDQFYSEPIMLQRDLKEPLDVRWFDLFLKKKRNQILYQLGAGCPQEMKQKIAAYFYRDIMNPPKYEGFDAGRVYRLMDALKEYGWTDWKGVLLAQAKQHPNINSYYWCWMFMRFRDCASQEVVYEEAKAVVELYDRYYQGGPGAVEIKNVLTQNGFYQE